MSVDARAEKILQEAPVVRRIPNAGPASEVDDAAPRCEVLLELNARRMTPGGSILDAPPTVESRWGDGHQSLWARAEPFLLCGPDAVGKTTLAGQLVLGLAGIGEASLLGFGIHGDGDRVLYLACDRPAQALRSFARMVSEKDRQQLDDRLAIWRGPLPFDLAAEPDALLAMARRAGASVVVLDSVKDVAADLSREETGLGLNRAFQNCCAAGVDVGALHHQRKAQAGAGKPRHLADVYGSRWLTAGAGSVVMLWGEAGDPVVELQHLKQPDELVGPLKVEHDHIAGRSSVLDHVDAYSIVQRSERGASAAEVATTVYGTDDDNAVRKARRQLERLANEGRIHRLEGDRGGAGGRSATHYFPISGRLEGT
ncbi:MAG TPA: AAA family ATPase [Acidimicrobiales bacterium]|nr:AAA family ATPase [Acidimicrobiales bacterium]